MSAKQSKKWFAVVSLLAVVSNSPGLLCFTRQPGRDDRRGRSLN